jgi:hypothetical protein
MGKRHSARSSADHIDHMDHFYNRMEDGTDDHVDIEGRGGEEDP